MNRLIIIMSAAVLLAAWVTSAQAQSIPLEIKGVPFGATADELLAKLPAAKCYPSGCRLIPSDMAEKQCGSIADAVRSKTDTSVMECRRSAIKELNFGPAPTSLYMFEFRNGKLANATIIFYETAHLPLVIALTEKYGKPTNEKSVPMQNRAGAKFENQIVTWDLPDGRIEVSQRGSTIDKGSVRMSTTEYLKETAKEMIDKAKASASKL